MLGNWSVAHRLCQAIEVDVDARVNVHLERCCPRQLLCAVLEIAINQHEKVQQRALLSRNVECGAILDETTKRVWVLRRL